jgi:hypothetical protein
MFNPQRLIADGILIAAGATIGTVVSPSVFTTIAGAAVSGIFICLAKGLELYIRAYTDKRVKELERQLRSANCPAVTKIN